MKARTRNAVTSLVLLAVAGGAVAYAYYGVQKKEEKEAAKEKTAKKLFPFTGKDVTALTLDRTGAGKDKLRLTKAGTDWRIVEPVQLDASRGDVQGIADHLASLNYNAEILPASAPAADLERFGLDKTSTRVEVEWGQGKTEALEVGKTNDFDGSLYVRKPGGPVLQLRTNGTKFFVEKTVLDLRDKRLLPFDDDKQVKKVEVKGLKVPYTFERDGDVWKLLSPIADRADATAVSRILIALRALRANGYVEKPGADKQYGFDKPRLSVRLTTTSGAEMGLEVGAAGTKEKSPKKPLAGSSEESFYARRLDGKREVATLFSFSLKDIEVDQVALQDKTVSSFDNKLATALHLQAGSNAMELQKKVEGTTESWYLTSPKAAPAKRFKVNSILIALSALKGTRVADATGKNLARYGLEHPIKVATVLGKDGKELGRLEVGKEEGDKVYVRGSVSPRVYELEKYRLAELPNAAEDMVETSTTAAPPAK